MFPPGVLLRQVVLKLLTLNYTLKDGTNWFLKNSPQNASIKIMIRDTVNKKYFSKKIQTEVKA